MSQRRGFCKLWRRLLWLLVLLPALAGAQQELEIISLRHRPLDQVLPALQPLLEAGGTLSGMGDQLFLRASRANREQIRQALAAIDTPARRLLIRVSQDRQAVSREQGGGISGQVVFDRHGRIVQPAAGNNGGTRFEVRRGDSVLVGEAGDWRGSGSSGSTQVVQVIDGGRALIHVGQSLPVPLRQLVFGRHGAVLSEAVVYRDLGQGFYAQPRVVGERVTLEISPQADLLRSRGDGISDTQRLTTTVSGRLGEWIELGGSNQQADFARHGNLHGAVGQASERRSVWLQVEELR
ncbi:MAG: hypothetical protein AW08_02424 [Candidatus Accumulibacter adjunctus]|uniref:NolW-like domain-containing protein n=1 Tax=Candidatus Accumulibacter adjunctus TaxID=1454001 RepID=A0A011NQD1_9PROT|nr:MAG: hypothetical protein AW08_02424 [Candidatus Accumulibacter adjunctus]